MSREEALRIWEEAKGFLRKHGYTIDLEQLDLLFPSWELLVFEPTDFKHRVALLIHEAVEMEENKRKWGFWADPREYVEKLGYTATMFAHFKAEDIEKLYLREVK